MGHICAKGVLLMLKDKWTNEYLVRTQNLTLSLTPWSCQNNLPKMKVLNLS